MKKDARSTPIYKSAKKDIANLKSAIKRLEELKGTTTDYIRKSELTIAIKDLKAQLLDTYQ